ncbi:MAG: GyrI-like domain-containing protein [Gammaproteobacteria bacterium]|nr:GyrI-like domain-containing protein [Gammaproteobacteria bacterium]
MSLDIRIEQQPPLHALEIATNAPMWKIPKVLGDAFPRIDKHIIAQGGTRAGAPYVRYMDIDWQQMRHCGPLRMLWLMLTSKQPMRIGMAVETPVEGGGEIEAVAIESLTCVNTIHRGPYQKVGDTYKKIVDWAEANDVKLANYTMENYINDPTTVAKEDIETLILIPVVGSPASTEDRVG